MYEHLQNPKKLKNSPNLLAFFVKITKFLKFSKKITIKLQFFQTLDEVFYYEKDPLEKGEVLKDAKGQALKDENGKEKRDEQCSNPNPSCVSISSPPNPVVCEFPQQSSKKLQFFIVVFQKILNIFYISPKAPNLVNF